MKSLRGALWFLAAATSLSACRGRVDAEQRRAPIATDTRVLARVNGEAITESEVKRMLAAPTEREQLASERGIDPSDDAALEPLAVRRLVRRSLILQEARRRGFTVTEQELAKAIASLRRRFDTLESMGLWMKEQGLDEQSLFDTLRSDLLAARVRGALVRDVRLDEEAVREYQDAHRGELKTEEVWLQVIAVKERAKAAEVLAALRRGEDFGELARRHSIGRRARQRGDMGWMNADTLGPPLRDAVRVLREGEARGPLVRGEELLIVRLEARRSSPMSPTAARREVERRLLPAAQRRAIEAWLDEHEKKATIEAMPRGRIAATES